MSETGSSIDASGSAANSATNASSQRVAYLDTALWGRLTSARSPVELAAFWLEIQCCMLEDVRRAAVYLYDEAQGGLVPVAFWPQRADGPTSLLTVARRVIAEKKGMVSGHVAGHAGSGSLCCAAYPFLMADSAYGAVAIEIGDRSEEKLRELMRSLQWGTSWVEVAYYRQQASASDHALTRSKIVLDLAGLLLEEERFSSAAKALVTELATRVGCDLVALGVTNKQNMDVVALSHSAEFGNQMNLVRSLSAAMQESTDQEMAVLFPPSPTGGYQVSRAHGEVAKLLNDATILTIPLLVGDTPVGALLFERSSEQVFDQECVELCDALAALVGPILNQKRRHDRFILIKLWDSVAGYSKRLFGPEFLGRKIAFGTIALLALVFSLLEGSYRISAPARIEGRIQRVIVAPFDGYIATQSTRAGDQVLKGDVLATLDNRDLSLEHTRWTTTRQQRLAEYDQMMAIKDRSGSKIVRAQIEQADAHIALLEEQLERTELRAAFDGLIVSGDLSQSVGAAVSRGEQLFELAPLDSYRVILEVDETQILDIHPGQVGQLKAASLLDKTLPYTIKQVVPVTESRDGRNFFRVEAILNEANLSLRPGMEGVGKTDVDDRLVIQIWTRDLFSWLRLKLWAWWP